MSMGLALAMLALTTLAVALLLVPLLLRSRRNETRDAYNLAVYRDQLAEIDRDVGRGIIGADEAAAAKSEIGRRILALAPGAAPAASSALPLAVAAVAIVVLPFAAWTLYWQLGSPTQPDQPFAARSQPAGATAAGAGTTSASDPHVDMADAMRKLTEHLKAHPDDVSGWLLLARSDVGMGRYADAVDAYRHAADLSGQKPEIVGDYGEALILAANGTVTPEARQAFQTALADPESAPRSRYYLALAKLQQGDAKAALQDWVDLEADSPADADWLPLLRRRIDEAARSAGVDPATLKTSAGAPRKTPPATPLAAGPSAAAPASPAAPQGAPSAAAAMPSSAEVAEAAKATQGMSAQDRQAMINTMVERLAVQLQQQPDDVEGWTRLGRSYLVLNQPAKAEEAFARAAKLKPDDPALKQQYAEAMIEAAGGDELPPQAADLFREILAADPKNAEALWYVGLQEEAEGHKDKAQDLLSRLLAQLPADAPVRHQVEERLAALKQAPTK